MPYSIGEIAKQGGVAASAIRYYEKLGMIPKAERQGGKRRFSDAASWSSRARYAAMSRLTYSSLAISNAPSARLISSSAPDTRFAYRSACGVMRAPLPP